MQRTTIITLSLITVAALSGCAHVLSLPPQITLTEVEPSGRAARPPGCRMPILRSEPLRPYRKVAIVEGVANVFADEADVLPLVASKACETGADALVVEDSRSQTSENMTGYYVNAVAIVYERRRGEKPGP